ncbi:hypothetical protein N9S81_00360 [bacterium]|nr:hypothetical protein [bacterium]
MTTSEPKSSVQFTPRVLLTLFRGALGAKDALAMQSEAITCRLLKSHGVSVSNIRVAGITPVQLKDMGCSSALELRELGFDALDLNNPSFCASSIQAFGAEGVKQAFLLSAGDAVALSGSTAMHQLDINSRTLITATAGCPTHAQSVLQQLQPRGAALFGCKAADLLDSGLRAKQLVDLGYHVDALREQTGASEEEIAKLGF